jgi:hypothetical protein
MITLQIIAETLGFTLASLATAALFSCVCWKMFSLVRHPQWAPPIVLVLLFAVFGTGVISAEFLRRTLGLAILAAFVLWALGRGNDSRSGNRPVANVQADDPPSTTRRSIAPQIYPAIVACLSEARSPNQAEFRKVARRIRRESFPARQVDRALRRSISRAALAALGVRQVPRPLRNRIDDGPTGI